MIKFGGTSVGGGPEFVGAAKIAAGTARDGGPAGHMPPAVVVSAMSGTTDALLGYADRATATGTTRTRTGSTREGSLAELRRALADRHLAAAREAVSAGHLPGVERRLGTLLDGLVETLALPAEDPETRRAAAVVFGERLSATILAGALESQGVPAAVVTGDPIATTGGCTDAEVDAEETRRRAARYVAPLLDAGTVAVVPGYVGCSPDGGTTTLGRGGSDLSATALGRALGSREVWILSDVDGVLDADPALIPGAALIPRLSYREAGAFATLGARILHPKTMEPASAAGMEVLVRSTFNPECPGTRVSGQETGEGVRSVGLRHGLSLLRCPGPETPFGEEVFCVLGADGGGLSYLADGGSGDAAGVVCIGSPGNGHLVSGLGALRRGGIGALWAGSTPEGLLFVVDGAEAPAALHALHAALVAEPEDTSESVAAAAAREVA